MRVETFTCDVCGAKKGPNNHWFMAFVLANGLDVITWDHERAVIDGWSHVCGELCLSKCIAQWAGKLVKP